MSDAYMKLSRYLPTSVCLRNATEAWDEISGDRSRVEAERRQREATAFTERMCELNHACLLLASDLWIDEVEKSTHVFAVPSAYVWMTPACAAALRRTARACSHAGDRDGFVDDVLAEIPRAEKFVSRRLRVGRAMAVRLQAFVRGLAARARVRRWLLAKFEKRTTDAGRVVYVDVDVEREQAEAAAQGEGGGFDMLQMKSARPLKRAKPPLALKREPNLGTPRAVTRRLDKERARGDAALARDAATRPANAARAAAEKDRLDSLYELAQLLNALEAAYRFLGRKLNGARFLAAEEEGGRRRARRRRPRDRRGEAQGRKRVIQVRFNAKKKKRAEYRIIFNRYDEDRGGTVDADELDAVFQDMGKVLPKEEIDAMLLEYGPAWKSSTRLQCTRSRTREHDEVYFDEFCTMLEALDAKEKKEQQRLEERAAREAAKHRAFAALAAPAMPPDDGAARARSRGSATPPADRDGVALGVRRSGSCSSPRARGARGRRPRLRRGARLARARVLPVPIDVVKKVDVFPLWSRYVCVLDGEGTLTAMSQRDAAVCHGPDFVRDAEDVVASVLQSFENARSTWARVAKAYDRREAREVAAELLKAQEGDGGGGVTDALMDLDGQGESKEEKEQRMRAIFDKYDDDGGGSVDAEELEAVFKDMGIEVPEPDEMQDMLEEFSGGKAEVEFEEFCLIVDALEQDDTAKMKRIFDKYDADGGGTMDAEELEQIFADLKMPLTSQQIEDAVEVHSEGEGEVNFEQFTEMVKALKDVKYDEDGGGTIDSEELAAIFADMGVDVGTEDIENLIGEYGGQEGVDEDTGMITEINFDEFVNMVAALPPTYEVPSIAKRCRDYADEVAEQLGDMRDDDDRFLPPAPDCLLVDVFVDSAKSQQQRDRELARAGVPVSGTPSTKPSSSVTPLLLDARLRKSTFPAPDLGLFAITETEALKGIRVKPPTPRDKRGNVIEKKKKKAPKMVINPETGEEEEEDDDDPSEYGWKEADAAGVKVFRHKIDRGRVFEFRCRDAPRSVRALQDALEPRDDGGGHFI
ncbi:hypothetical protein JL722_2806 [Aureococcus anophagefferens]|nr:hypothetical protein JL722_2806 [Aureococcus anophagefferens]